MNRRSLFRLLTGAAAAVGLGKVPPGETLRLRMIPPETVRPWIVRSLGPPLKVWMDGGPLTQEQRNERANAFADYCSRAPHRIFLRRRTTPRQRLLDALDESRSARLASKYNL